MMKATDDYTAKVRFWATERQIAPLPYVFRIPGFRSRKFSSYDEFNAWKREVILSCARSEACREPDTKDLLAAKEASGRPQDQIDSDFLQQLIGETEI